MKFIICLLLVSAQFHTKYFSNQKAVTIQHNLMTSNPQTYCYDSFSEPVSFEQEVIDSRSIIVRFDRSTTGRCEVWR